VTNPVVE